MKEYNFLLVDEELFLLAYDASDIGLLNLSQFLHLRHFLTLRLNLTSIFTLVLGVLLLGLLLPDFKQLHKRAHITV